MSHFTSTTPWYPTSTAGEGLQSKKFDTSLPAENDASVCDWGTNTATRYILVKPVATNTSSSIPDVAADDMGWNVLRTNMNIPDPTEAGFGDRPGRRKVLSGTWTFNCVLGIGVADNLAPANTYRCQARVYRRDAAAGYSQLLTGETNIASSDITVGDLDVDVTASTSGAFEFALDETCHVEFWLQGRGIAITGQTVTFSLGQPALKQEVKIDHPAVMHIYERSVAADSSVVPATPVRKVGKPLTASAKGRPTFSRKVGKFFNVRAGGSVVLNRALVLRRSMSVTSRGIARAFAKLDFTILGRMTSGGTTIIKKVIAIFED